MKKIKFLALLIITIIGFQSCQDDDSLTYIAQPEGEFTFSNSFLSEYILTSSASSNLAERFTWDNANFGVETNVTYEMQKSITGDFSDMEIIGSTENNEYPVTIGDMLQYASEAGLDNDPLTMDIPNTGSVYFRVRAYVGANSSVELTSISQALTVTLLENTGNSDPACDLDQLWLVGAGVPDAGWGWGTPVSIPCSGDGVYSGNVTFSSTVDANNFRFFTVEGDWNSGQNYPYYDGEGYTIDADFEDAMDGDNNFAYIGMDGVRFLEIDTVNKTITLSAPQSTGDCEFDQLWLVGAGVPDAGWGWTTPVQLLCTGDSIYSGDVTFANDAFRFFTVEGDWNSGLNYPYYDGEGYTIDANFTDAMDGDNNFSFTGTPGTYSLTVDTANKTITID